MPRSSDDRVSPLLGLTPRQRRLRVLSVLIIVAIAGMVYVGRTHPLFRTPRFARAAYARSAGAPNQAGALRLTPLERRRLAVRGLVILCYWSVCLSLPVLLILLALLDVRETRKKELTARRDLWKDLAQRSEERRRKGDR